jgi:hypothetical protein
MAWIDGKALWFFLPVLTAVFVGGQPVLDPMCMADALENMDEGQCVALAVRKFDAAIGQHRIEFAWYGGDQVVKELGGDHPAADALPLETHACASSPLPLFWI